MLIGVDSHCCKTNRHVLRRHWQQCGCWHKLFPVTRCLGYAWRPGCWLHVIVPYKLTLYIPTTWRLHIRVSQKLQDRIPINRHPLLSTAIVSLVTKCSAWSWSRCTACRWVFKSSLAVGCHYIHPSSRRTSPSFNRNQVILLSRHIGVNDLPKVATQLPSENRTHVLMIASPTLYR